MSPDESPVLDSEVLLRRVPSDPAKFLFPDGPIQLQAFLPTVADTDGLSLYRELIKGTETGFLTAETLLASSTNERVRVCGGVVGIKSEAVRKIENFTIVPNPDELPGHVIIPEMNAIAYKQNKQQVKDWADKIVRASHIIIKPKPI